MTLLLLLCICMLLLKDIYYNINKKKVLWF